MLTLRAASAVAPRIGANFPLRRVDRARPARGRAFAPRASTSLDDMQVTLVHVSAKPGTEEAFVAASLANATNSVEEPDNCRFDCLQDLDDPSRFVLVEIYRTPAGPAAHKETSHYLTWRDEVADMMAEPRAARKYVPIYPWPNLWGTTAASRRNPDPAPEADDLARRFLTLDADPGRADEEAGFDLAALVDGLGDAKVITHVHVRCKPGTEDDFAEASMANAAASVLEPGNLRFDVLRDAEDPTRFLLVEVYADAEGPVAHKATPHYAQWRKEVEEMMAAPREAKRYVARFPVEPEAWKMTLSEV